MTEAEPSVAQEPPPPEISPREPPEPQAAARLHLLGWSSLLGFLVLLVAIALAWLYPRYPPVSDEAALARLNTRVDVLSQKLAESEKARGALAGAEAKLAQAEKALAARPALPAPDLGPIEARLRALEKRPKPAPVPVPTPTGAAPGAASLAASLAPLSERIAALQNSLAGLAPLPARVDRLEKSFAELPSLSRRIDSVGKKIADLASLSGRIDGLQKSLASLGKQVDGMEFTVRLAGASVALAEGKPLGNLPGAPPALARFATRAPPTLASLRLSFSAAANAEREAARPADEGQPFTKRVMDRLGDLVTVREGSKVLVGNPAVAVLANARTALDAGNLQAAVAAVGSLPQPLAPAMQQWKDQATSLLAAEAALMRLSGTR